MPFAPGTLAFDPRTGRLLPADQSIAGWDTPYYPPPTMITQPPVSPLEGQEPGPGPDYGPPPVPAPPPPVAPEVEDDYSTPVGELLARGRLGGHPVEPEPIVPQVEPQSTQVDPYSLPPLDVAGLQARGLQGIQERGGPLLPRLGNALAYPFTPQTTEPGPPLPPISTGYLDTGEPVMVPQEGPSEPVKTGIPILKAIGDIARSIHEPDWVNDPRVQKLAELLGNAYMVNTPALGAARQARLGAGALAAGAERGVSGAGEAVGRAAAAVGRVEPELARGVGPLGEELGTFPQAVGRGEVAGGAGTGDLGRATTGAASGGRGNAATRAEAAAEKRTVELQAEYDELNRKVDLPSITDEELIANLTRQDEIVTEFARLGEARQRHGELIQELSGIEGALPDLPGAGVLPYVRAGENAVPEQITRKQYVDLMGGTVPAIQVGRTGPVKADVYMEELASRAGMDWQDFEKAAQQAIDMRNRAARLRGELAGVRTEMENLAPQPRQAFKPSVVAQQGGVFVVRHGVAEYTVYERGGGALGKLTMEKTPGARGLSAVFRWTDAAGQERNLLYLGVKADAIKDIDLAGLRADVAAHEASVLPTTGAGVGAPPDMTFPGFERNASGTEPRRLSARAAGTTDTAAELRAAIEADPRSYYDPIPNETTARLAQEFIQSDPQGAYNLVMLSNGPLDNVTSAVGIVYYQAAERSGNYATARAIMEQLSERATTGGQGIQALVLLTKQSPEGFLRQMIKYIQDAGGEVRLTDAEQNGLLRSVRSTGSRESLGVVRTPKSVRDFAKELDDFFGGEGGALRPGGQEKMPAEVQDAFWARAAEIKAMGRTPEAEALRKQLMDEVHGWQPPRAAFPSVPRPEEAAPRGGPPAGRQERVQSQPVGSHEYEFGPTGPGMQETLSGPEGSQGQVGAGRPTGPGMQSTLLGPEAGTGPSRTFPEGPGYQEGLPSTNLPRPSGITDMPSTVGAAQGRNLPELEGTRAPEGTGGIHAFPGGPSEQGRNLAELEGTRMPVGSGGEPVPQYPAGGTQPTIAGMKLPVSEEEAVAQNKALKAVIRRYKGRNLLTNEVAHALTQEAERIHQMPSGDAKLWAQSILMRDMHELVPATISRKVVTGQTISMLLTLTNTLQNAASNALRVVSENMVQTFGAFLDTAFVAAGKERAVHLPRLGTQAQGLVAGLKEGVQEAATGTSIHQALNRFEMGGGRVFPYSVGDVFAPGLTTSQRLSRLATVPLHYAEQGTGLAVGLPDRATWMAARQGSLAEQASTQATKEGLTGTAHAAREAELFLRPTKGMLDKANARGLVWSYNDQNWAALGSQALKNLLNTVGVGPLVGRAVFSAGGVSLRAHELGLGDLATKFARVPATLIKVGVEYSPLGFTGTLFDVTKQIAAGNVDREQAILRFSRALLGTGGLTGAGYLGAQAGFLTGRGTLDPNERATEATAGRTAYQLNASAAWRFLTSGGKSQVGKWEKGDVLYDLRWAQPFTLPVNLGTTWAERGKRRVTTVDRNTPAGNVWEKLGGAVSDTAAQALETSAEVMGQTNVISNIIRIAGGDDAHPLHGLALILANAPSTLVPQLLNQVNQYLDNQMRVVKDDSAIREGANTLVSRIPGYAAILPERVDVFGDPMDRYTGNSNTFFNIFVNPAKRRQFLPSPQAEMAMALYQATGDASAAPQVAPRSLSFTITQADGAKLQNQRYELTPEEQMQLQRFMGEKTREAYGNLAANESFRQALPKDQLDMLNRVQTAINEESKAELQKWGSGRASGLPRYEPSKPVGHKTLNAQTATDYFEALPFLKKYDSVDEVMIRANPAYQRAVEYRDNLLRTGGAQAQHDFDGGHTQGVDELVTYRVWKDYERAVTLERRRLRSTDPALEKALEDWRGMEPYKPPKVRVE